MNDRNPVADGCTTDHAWLEPFGQQDSAVGSRIANNAQLPDRFAQMIALQTPSATWSQTSAQPTPAIAAWNSSAHVEAPPKKGTSP